MPHKLSDRFTIHEAFTVSLPYEQDRLILAAIIRRDGTTRSGGVRTALREYGRRHFPHLSSGQPQGLAEV
jgi:hypothetical protein